MKEVKSKITGLNAKTQAKNVTGKDPKSAITGNKVSKSKVDLPSVKGKSPKLKAKSSMK